MGAQVSPDSFSYTFALPVGLIRVSWSISGVEAFQVQPAAWSCCMVCSMVCCMVLLLVSHSAILLLELHKACAHYAIIQAVPAQSMLCGFPCVGDVAACMHAAKQSVVCKRSRAAHALASACC